MARDSRGSAAQSNTRADAGPVNFLNPETAVSGLASNFIGTITDARWESWDFKGKAKAKPDGKSGVKMALHITIDDRDDGEDAHEEFISAGAIEDFIPADDGLSFDSPTGKKGFYKDNDIIMFTEAVVETGALKPTELGIDPSVFVGLTFYWERKAPKWRKADSTSKSEVLVPSKFHGKAKGVKAPTPAPAAASRRGRAAEPEVEEEAPAATGRGGRGGRGGNGKDTDEGSGADEATIELATKVVMEVIEALPAKQKTISREDLGAQVYATLMTKHKKDVDKEQRTAITDLFESDDFLEANQGRKTWGYDAKEGLVEL